jgi:hypothetical protein
MSNDLADLSAVEAVGAIRSHAVAARLQRGRVVLAEDARIGFMPARAAKAASEGIRPGWEPTARMMAPGTRPRPQRSWRPEAL